LFMMRHCKETPFCFSILLLCSVVNIHHADTASRGMVSSGRKGEYKIGSF
jgi:hypothetical protein